MKKEINKDVKWDIILPLLILLLGFCLLVFMITYESEPGALPLVLILSGLGFLISNWYKSKKKL